MIIISHRGNLDGVRPDMENSIPYIQKALDEGFDVEVDLRIKDGSPHLGHDRPDHPVQESWLLERRDRLWIHVKEREALAWILKSDLNFFFHERDPYVLMSNGLVWAHDLSMSNKNFVVPLLSLEDLDNFRHELRSFYGVCSDFPLECRKRS